MMEETLFEAVCDYRVLKIYKDYSREYKYFDTFDEARENLRSEKYCEMQWLEERKNGKWETLNFRRRQNAVEMWDWRLCDDGSHAEPFGSMLERSMARRAAKEARLTMYRERIKVNIHKP